MARGVKAAEAISIRGPSGTLQALVEAPPAPGSVAVVCHPHPLHGGAMKNKVVHTLARTFYRAGAAAVRFNFRGVGESEGVFADGVGERQDAAAVAEWALESYPGAQLYLAGFSFGAAVAAAIAPRFEIAGLVTVALPVARLPDDFVPTDRPWLIVHGSKDEIVALEDVTGWRARHAPNARLEVLDGATHFFHGRLTDLADRVRTFIADAGERGADLAAGSKR